MRLRFVPLHHRRQRPADTRSRILLRVLALLPIAVLIPSCGGEPQGPELEQETYVEVMVALRRAHSETATPAEYEARRAEILRDAGVSDSLLVQWTRANAHDVAMLAALWDSINQRLMAVEDSVR